MSENETLRQQLLYAPKNGYDRLSETDRAAMRAYCQDYMHFLDAAKTEREAVIGPVLLQKRPAELGDYARFRIRVAAKALEGARRGVEGSGFPSARENASPLRGNPAVSPALGALSTKHGGTAN